MLMMKFNQLENN